MAEYIDVEQARTMSGLRLVLAVGIPGPWGEALKGLFHVKKVPYVRVRHDVGSPNTELQEWTAQTSAPVAIWNDERPRSSWIEQLFLAERLASMPALVPTDINERARMIGYCHELCGEMGLGWCRRLMLLHGTLSNPQSDDASRAFATHLGQKYGYTPEVAAKAPERVAQILQLLSARLAQQQAKGQTFFMGDQLSALDIYWAAFAALIEPLPHDVCPMPDVFRAMYANTDPTVQAAVTPALMAHRDFIYREYLGLPIEL